MAGSGTSSRPQSHTAQTKRLQRIDLHVDTTDQDILILRMDIDPPSSASGVHLGKNVYVGGNPVPPGSFHSPSDDVYRIPKSEFGNLLLELHRQFLDILEN